MRLFIELTLALIISFASNWVEAQIQPVEGVPAGESATVEITELQKKAEAGDSSAEFALGQAYETGKDVHRDFQRAAFWYRKAAEQGNPKAQGSLGVLYWIGEGVEKEREQAITWYRKAARQGEPSAMFNLGVAYYNGDVVTGNETTAHAWFLLASEAGSAVAADAARRSQSEYPGSYTDACFAIGQMYEKGDDLPRDVGQATAWYQKAAQSHGRIASGEAEFRLADLYLRDGDYARARPWCEAVAKAHNLGGAYCLGRLYHDGLGVSKDLKAALEWYRRDALRGHIAAMYALGQMYENGEGTKVDRAEAMNWLIRAATGNPRYNDAAAEARNAKDAAAEARKLRASMSEAEWEKTQKKLKDYHLDVNKVEAFLQAGDAQSPR
ncbi:MAG: tetratricopeptide repeat protein [Terriglobales bacterium]